MFKLYFALAVVCFLFGFIRLKRADEEKQYDYFFDKLERINSTENQIFDETLTVNKESRTKFIADAEVEQHVELNDEYQVGFNLNWASPEDPENYQLAFNGGPITFCEFMKSYYAYIYNNIENKSNIPPPDKCPLPPAKYTLKESALDVSWLQSLTKPGNYRVDVYLMKGDNKVVEYQLFGHVVEV